MLIPRRARDVTGDRRPRTHIHNTYRERDGGGCRMEGGHRSANKKPDPASPPPIPSPRPREPGPSVEARTSPREGRSAIGSTADSLDLLRSRWSGSPPPGRAREVDARGRRAGRSEHPPRSPARCERARLSRSPTSGFLLEGGRRRGRAGAKLRRWPTGFVGVVRLPPRGKDVRVSG